MRQQASLIVIVALGIACTTTSERSTTSSDGDAAFIAATSTATAQGTGAPSELPLSTGAKSTRVDDTLGRDPFQPGSTAVVTPPPPREDGIPRKAKKYSLEQLKLVGIVGGDEQPRAMLVDPNGKGWIVTRGEYVGRAENLTGWRVDKVRGDDVVFTRTDPLRPTQAPETRVVALHTPAASDSAELDD